MDTFEMARKARQIRKTFIAVDVLTFEFVARIFFGFWHDIFHSNVARFSFLNVVYIPHVDFVIAFLVKNFPTNAAFMRNS